jgi:hypothetical protein
MLSLSRDAQPTTLDLEATPAGWPSWTDDRLELGPDPSGEDTAWWAAHSPGRDDCYDVEALDERAALEAAALASIELGLIPADLAHAINRTSLAGSDADAILHQGSNPTWCPCLPCTMDRTRRYAE